MNKTNPKEVKMKINKTILIVAFLLANPAVFATTKHLQIQGLDKTEWSNGDVMNYIHANLDPLPLDLEIEQVDEEVKDGNDISLVFTDAECPEQDAYGTRKFTLYKSEQLGPYEITIPYDAQVIKIHHHCWPLDASNRTNAFYNSWFHELICHALTNDPSHLKYLPGLMPRPLCNSLLSTDKLYFEWNDKRRLLNAFGQHGRKLKFKEDDVGRTCYLLYRDGSKSVSFPITDTEMRVDWLKRNRVKTKKVIQ